MLENSPAKKFLNANNFAVNYSYNQVMPSISVNLSHSLSQEVVLSALLLQPSNISSIMVLRNGRKWRMKLLNMLNSSTLKLKISSTLLLIGLINGRYLGLLVSVVISQVRDKH